MLVLAMQFSKNTTSKHEDAGTNKPRRRRLNNTTKETSSFPQNRRQDDHYKQVLQLEANPQMLWEQKAP
jgi:hypothetical protein